MGKEISRSKGNAKEGRILPQYLKSNGMGKPKHCRILSKETMTAPSPKAKFEYSFMCPQCEAILKLADGRISLEAKSFAELHEGRTRRPVGKSKRRRA